MGRLSTWWKAEGQAGIIATARRKPGTCRPTVVLACDCREIKVKVAELADQADLDDQRCGVALAEK